MGTGLPFGTTCPTQKGFLGSWLRLSQSSWLRFREQTSGEVRWKNLLCPCSWLPLGNVPGTPGTETPQSTDRQPSTKPATPRQVLGEVAGGEKEVGHPPLEPRSSEGKLSVSSLGSL